jgi:hypothetical protein
VKHIIAYLYHRPETLDCQCMYFAFDILNRKLRAHAQSASELSVVKHTELLNYLIYITGLDSQAAYIKAFLI